MNRDDLAEARRQVHACVQAIRKALVVTSPADQGKALSDALSAALHAGIVLDDMVLELAGADTLPMPPESTVKEVAR